MKTIENFTKKDKMDKTTLEYLQKNKAQITDLNKIADQFHDEIKKKLQRLNSLIESIPPNEKFYSSKQIWSQNWIKQKLESLLFLTLTTEVCGKSPFNVKIRIRPLGWMIEYWDIKEISDESKKILISKSKEKEKFSEKKSDHICCQSFNFNADIEEVFEDFYKTIHELKQVNML